MTGGKLTDIGSHFGNGLEATKHGDNQLKRHFILGDILWIKIRDSSWWPSQVADEKNVSYKPNKRAKDEVLVRLYGTYDYLYVDPVKSSSEFENILKQEKNSIRETFQKALEEDLSRMKSAGNSKRKVSESKVGDKASRAKCAKQGGAGKPDGTENTTNGASKVKNKKRDGLNPSKLKDVEEPPKTENPSDTKGEETGNLSARRVRVMQSLGLIAPSGSPFRKNRLV